MNEPDQKPKRGRPATGKKTETIRASVPNDVATAARAAAALTNDGFSAFIQRAIIAAIEKSKMIPSK